MIRNAARQFTGWDLCPDADGWLAECAECPKTIGVSAGPLAPWLDQLLDHDWEHSPEAAGAPTEHIDDVLGRLGDAA